MEEAAAVAMAAASKSSGGRPAPFLTKTHQMVEERATDEVISWAEQGRSFVVWKPVELARDLLPLHFKHCNFSSFVRQLNTYVSTRVVLVHSAHLLLPNRSFRSVYTGIQEGSGGQMGVCQRRVPERREAPSRRDTEAEGDRTRGGGTGAGHTDGDTDTDLVPAHQLRRGASGLLVAAAWIDGWS